MCLRKEKKRPPIDYKHDKLLIKQLIYHICLFISIWKSLIVKDMTAWPLDFLAHLPALSFRAMLIVILIYCEIDI